MFTTKTETTERKAPDKSPENDLNKAIDLLRNARAKMIRGGNEKRAGNVLEIIGQAEMVRDGKEGA